MRRSIALVAMALFASSAHASQLIGILPDSAAKAFYVEHRSDYDTELRAISAANGTVTRVGGRLTVRGAKGRPLILVDTLAEGDQHHRYLYRGWLADLGIHDVEMWFYEGGLHIVMDAKSGQTKIIPGPPVSSPDKQRFASASEDLEPRYQPNKLEIWRVTGAGFNREFVVDGGEAWGPDELQWLGPTVLRYERVSLSSAGARQVATRWLVNSNGRWNVRSSAP